MGLVTQARIKSHRPVRSRARHDGLGGGSTHPTNDTSGSANLGVRPTARTQAYPHRTGQAASSLPTSKASSSKGVELANHTSEYLSEITATAQAGIDRIRHTPRLLYSFLHATGLKAW